MALVRHANPFYRPSQRTTTPALLHGTPRTPVAPHRHTLCGGLDFLQQLVKKVPYNLLDDYVKRLQFATSTLVRLVNADSDQPASDKQVCQVLFATDASDLTDLTFDTHGKVFCFKDKTSDAPPNATDEEFDIWEVQNLEACAHDISTYKFKVVHEPVMWQLYERVAEIHTARHVYEDTDATLAAWRAHLNTTITHLRWESMLSTARLDLVWHYMYRGFGDNDHQIRRVTSPQRLVMQSVSHCTVAGKFTASLLPSCRCQGQTAADRRRCLNLAKCSDIRCRIHSDLSERNFNVDVHDMCRVFRGERTTEGLGTFLRCCMIVCRRDYDMGYYVPTPCGNLTMSSAEAQQLGEEQWHKLRPMQLGNRLVFCSCHAHEVATEKSQTAEDWLFEQHVQHPIEVDTGGVFV